MVEARERSGALITADLALEEGREVFAVPGEITSALSAGTNALLKLGASPLTCAEDLLSCFGLEAAEPPGAAPSGDAARVLAALRESAAGADELTRATGLPASGVARALVELELDGRVIAADGVYRPVAFARQ